MAQQGQSKGEQSQKATEQDRDAKSSSGQPGASPKGPQQQEQAGSRASQQQGGEHADEQARRVGQQGQESGQGRQRQP